MKQKLLFILLVLPLCFGFSKTKYTYYVVQQAPIDTATTYVFPNSEYIYRVSIKEVINGNLPASFTGTLENGLFTSNGKATIDKIPGFYDLAVKWNDIPNVYSKISITGVSTDTANVVLQKGRAQIAKLIASLKGQTPNLVVTGGNPPMATKPQLNAQVLEDVIYPGIYEKNILGVMTNKTARKFEWTLPKGWTTADGQHSGTFITNPDVKQIAVIPNYFTPGAIQVRAVNDIGSAFSDVGTQNFDRGFSFTNYPTSAIPFGQVSTYTFAVTPIAGVSFEWNVPAGWQINGQGNVLEGVGLNSISVTTTGFCANSSVVQVRLKKDAEVSDWFTCPYPGVSQPTITNGTSTIYQYEDANFSLSNISVSGINSISWSGDGVLVLNNQGVNSKIVFTKSGTIELKATVVLAGCSTPIIRSKSVVVNPSRLSISGPSQICSSSATFTIDNLSTGATVAWSSNGLTPYSGTGTSFTASPVNYAGAGYVRATITIGSSTFAITKNLELNGYTFIDGPDEEYLSTGKAYFTMDESVTVSQWTVNGVVMHPAMPNTLILSPLSNYYPGSVMITCTGTTNCGTFTAIKNFEVIDDMGYSLYPNPASDQVQITMLDTSSSSLQATSTASSTNATANSHSVRVLDVYGSVVYSDTKAGKQFNLPTSKLGNGVYNVIISNGNKVYQKKLIVRH
jgi:hypothetical protein